MQEMQRKQREQQLFYDLIKEGAGKTVEERVEYNKDLEYNKHANLFAVSYSTIHKAACDGSVSGIKYFMSLKSKPRIKSDDLDKFGIRPIHYAAERGFNDAVETLLSFGCNVDARTSDDMTAMMFASKAGKLDTMRPNGSCCRGQEGRRGQRRLGQGGRGRGRSYGRRGGELGHGIPF